MTQPLCLLKLLFQHIGRKKTDQCISTPSLDQSVSPTHYQSEWNTSPGWQTANTCVRHRHKSWVTPYFFYMLQENRKWVQWFIDAFQACIETEVYRANAESVQKEICRLFFGLLPVSLKNTCQISHQSHISGSSHVILCQHSRCY